MSDIKLFRLMIDGVQAIAGSSMGVEKSLQTLIEQHLETFLGVRFLASEFTTTKSHGGRIDTLGLDETNCPVIIEYKRALNENVISQGLFYLDWLMDHRGDFRLLVMEKLGSEPAKHIDWHYPRLVCIAGDFTKYDLYAIQQIPRNIDLIRYQRYGDDLLLLEQIARSSVSPANQVGGSHPGALGSEDAKTGSAQTEPAVFQHLQNCSAEVQDWYHKIKAFILGLGDDIEERALPNYIAFRRLKTFAYIHFSTTKNRIAVEVPLPPGSVPIEKDFTEQKPRNYVRILVDSPDDVERAEPIIALAYDKS